MEYHCYSDASFQAGYPAGYAFYVRTFENATWRSFRNDSGVLPETETSFEAELLAMLRALAAVPDNVQGYSHTDMVQLPVIIEAPKLRHAARPILQLLKQELRRTGLVLDYTDRCYRTEEYRKCHRLARVAQKINRNAVRRARRGIVVPQLDLPAEPTPVLNLDNPNLIGGLVVPGKSLIRDTAGWNAKLGIQ